MHPFFCLIKPNVAINDLFWKIFYIKWIISEALWWQTIWNESHRLRLAISRTLSKWSRGVESTLLFWTKTWPQVVATNSVSWWPTSTSAPLSIWFYFLFFFSSRKFYQKYNGDRESFFSDRHFGKISLTHSYFTKDCWSVLLQFVNKSQLQKRIKYVRAFTRHY